MSFWAGNHQPDLATLAGIHNLIPVARLDQSFGGEERVYLPDLFVIKFKI